jgi:hypothetical protein
MSNKFVRMKAPEDIKICFIRLNEQGIEILQIVSFTTEAQTEEDVLSRLERALTGWMYSTDEGKDAWDRSVGAFSIRDLLTLVDQSGHLEGSLKAFMEKEGIFLIKDVCSLGNIGQQRYDRILVQPLEL